MLILYIQKVYMEEVCMSFITKGKLNSFFLLFLSWKLHIQMSVCPYYHINNGIYLLLPVNWLIKNKNREENIENWKKLERTIAWSHGEMASK